MARFRANLVCFGILSCLFLLVKSKTVTVSIDVNQPVHQVNDKFLSVAFGASMIDSRRYPLKDVLRSRKLITLAKALAPAYLRLGGTAADFITFEPDTREEDDCCEAAKKQTNVVDSRDSIGAFDAVAKDQIASRNNEEDEEFIDVDDEIIEELI